MPAYLRHVGRRHFWRMISFREWYHSSVVCVGHSWYIRQHFSHWHYTESKASKYLKLSREINLTTRLNIPETFSTAEMNTGMPVATLVALCTAFGVHGAPVTSDAEPWWCEISMSESRRTNLADSTVQEISHVDRFANRLFNEIPGLQGRGRYCHSVQFPRSPVSRFANTELLRIANYFWDLSVLQYAYRSMLGQWILQGRNESLLETFGILLDHSYGTTERNLQADRCSCGGDNCTLNYPTTETWKAVTRLVSQQNSRPRCCTQMHFLSSIIARVKQTLRSVRLNVGDLHLKGKEEMGSVWYMCNVQKTIPKELCG